jgi:hypothetical protein
MNRLYLARRHDEMLRPQGDKKRQQDESCCRFELA